MPCALALALLGAVATLDGASAPPLTRHTRAINVGDAQHAAELLAVDASDAHAAAALDELERALKLLAATGPDIAAINGAAGGDAVTVSPEVFAVLVEVQRNARLSKGALDPTAGALARATAGAAEPPSKAERKRLLGLSGVDQLVLNPANRTARLRSAGARLDVAGVARGYALDRARGRLLVHGVTNFVLSLGGDLVLQGKKADEPWVVGVKDPGGEDAFLTLPIAAGAEGVALMLATATPLTEPLYAPSGAPASASLTAAVLHSDALTAACLARAAFVLGAAGLPLVERSKGADAVIVDAKGRVLLTNGLRARARKGELLHRPPTLPR